MHDQTAEGNEFFKCDFCLRPWADDRPMVEGHKGSLICGDCLRTAFTNVLLKKEGEEVPEDQTCALCLEHHDGLHWRRNPGGAPACKRCINQSARILAKDKETGWVLPA